MTCFQLPEAIITTSVSYTHLAFGWLAGVRDWWNRLLIVLVNILTNPAVVFLYYVNDLYLGWNPMIVTVALEAAAAAVEAVCYRSAGKIRRPWLFSIGANLFSVTLGAVVTKCF